MRFPQTFFKSGLFYASSFNVSPMRLAATKKISISSVLFDLGRLYTQKHEWISVKDKVGTVGISTFAQEALGDVVYVETPDVGLKLQRGEPTGAIESVKAASDVYSPVSGTVIEKNAELDRKPFLINKSTYEKGWLYKISVDNSEELKELLDEKSYEKFCEEEQNAQE